CARRRRAPPHLNGLTAVDFGHGDRIAPGLERDRSIGLTPLLSRFAMHVADRRDDSLLQFTLELEGVFVDDVADDVVGVSCVDPGEYVSRRRPDFIQLRSQIAVTVAAEHAGFIASA